MAAGGEEAVGRVVRVDGEAVDVDEGREGEGDEEIGGDELWLVGPDVGPQGEVGALDGGADGGEAEGDEGGWEGWGGGISIMRGWVGEVLTGDG